MRKLGIIIICLFIGLQFCGAKDSREKAVKKAVSAARTNIKNGTNLDQAENSMRELLRDSANVGDEKILMTLLDAVKKQYSQLNEKLYLKQESDTAAFFNHTKHTYDVLQSLDSIGAKSEVKWVSWQNLYSGGSYFTRKGHYEKAYRFIQAYLDKQEEDSIQAANWSTYCGYKLNKLEMVQAHAALALEDSVKNVYVAQYLAELYLQEQDTVNYVKALEYGYEKHPENKYMQVNLGIYHTTMLFQQERYDECIALSDSLLTIDPSLVVARRNLGLSYYNQTIPLAKIKIKSKDERAQLNALYEKAMPHMEAYRKARPKEKEIWAKPLYNIYLNLNKGDEFEEIERILNN